MIYNCLLVDDEPLAHTLLETYINKFAFLKVIGNCYNAFDAIQVLNEKKVDILFLDINMPQFSGLDMLQSLEKKPQVIFTTAYAEHALVSYDLGVVDYLLKPIKFDRFVKAINKIAQFPKNQQEDTLQNFQKKIGNEEGFITHRDKKGLEKIPFSEILFAEAMGNYTKVHRLKKAPIILSKSLKIVEDELSVTHFVRIHKSYLVNKIYIEYTGGKKIKIGTTQLPIGTVYTLNIKNLFK